jgi:hypothetical protein
MSDVIEVLAHAAAEADVRCRLVHPRDVAAHREGQITG